ncbi:MAG TPA: type II secretion system F family protein [Gemmataceae bacterium]|nr:type II secretion system F family protein [Gemmataceae bacterium]HEV3446206.1 type II secretion system F family protein [Gemmataceae bacterium]
MTPLMISLVAFVAVSALVGLVAFVFRDNNTTTAERLDTLIGKRGKEDPGADILKKSAFESDKKSFMEAITPNLPSLQKICEQADSHIKVSTLFGIGLALGVLGATGSWLARVPWFFAPLAGLVMFFIPFMWLLNKRRVRLKQFASQLPDALELVARALRAGHSLAAGMHVVAEEMPSPISDEFGRVYEEQNLGIPIEDSMRNICERVPNLDLRFFVTSVAIQRQTGGDLAEILDKIGYVIRERYRILGQVKALTAEGRLSGVVLIALPFVLFLVMLHIKPDYIQLLWTEPLGIKMAVFGLIAQILGAITIKKIIDIKV